MPQSLTNPLNCDHRLIAAVRPTTLIESRKLSEALGCSILLASETFQHTGSFKFRAAYNVALRNSAQHLIAASSGNFGQALAYACKLLEKRCTIVMPVNSAAVKIQSVRHFGGEVELIDTTQISRADKVAELAFVFPEAAICSAYDDELVIEGNASLGLELAPVLADFDQVIVPIGGGGLVSGVIRGLRQNNCQCQIFAAEPALANDAARSIQSGQIIANEQESTSIADGARTISVGKTNFPILQQGLAKVYEVEEAQIKQATVLLFELANLKCEPTGALSVGAVLANKNQLQGQKICCIVSGGNVDPALYASLLQSRDVK